MTTLIVIILEENEKLKVKVMKLQDELETAAIVVFIRLIFSIVFIMLLLDYRRE